MSQFYFYLFFFIYPFHFIVFGLNKSVKIYVFFFVIFYFLFFFHHPSILQRFLFLANFFYYFIIFFFLHLRSELMQLALFSSLVWQLKEMSKHNFWGNKICTHPRTSRDTTQIINLLELHCVEYVHI